MDGDVKSWDASFNYGLKFPRDPDGAPEQTINCFPGDTLIDANSVKKIFRRFYHGQLITIKTASGGELSGTPNHPVLTQRGWIALSKLTKGDYLIKASVTKSAVGTKIDMNVMPSTFKEIFKASIKPDASVWNVASGANFHGDISTSDVDIINVKGFLKDSVESNIVESVANNCLTDSDLAKSKLFSDSRVDQSLSFGGSIPNSVVGSSNLRMSLSDTHSRPFNSLRLTSTELSKTSIIEPSIDCNSSDTELFRQLINANVFNKVEMDEIIDINIRAFSDHVYNLETNENMYVANGFIAHNCRCSFIMIPGEEADRMELEELVVDAENTATV